MEGRNEGPACIWTSELQTDQNGEDLTGGELDPEEQEEPSETGSSGSVSVSKGQAHRRKKKGEGIEQNKKSWAGKELHEANDQG